jgi:small basic protein
MRDELIEPSFFVQKIIIGFKLIAIGTPILLFIEKYVFSDWDFLISLMLLVGFNTIVGSIAAVIHSQFTSKLFYKKLSIKIFGIATVLIGVGILKKAKIDGEENYYSEILDAGIYALLGGLELLSVLKNAYKIYPHHLIKDLIELIESWYFKKINRSKDENQRGGDQNPS